MKSFLILISFFYISFSCTGLKNINSKDTNKTEKISQESYYYAVNINFRDNSLDFVTKTKLDGKLNFFLQTPVDLFLVAYENEKLVYFDEVFDPLTMRSAGGGKEFEKRLKEGNTTLNFPGFFDDKSKSLEIFIFKNINYIENFEELVKSKKELAKLEENNSIIKKYKIKTIELVEFLNKD